VKIKYKENPGAWRTSTLLTLLGLALVSSLLRWRHVLPLNYWLSAMVVLGCAAVVVCIRPQWFRGYYRFSTWAGFWSSQAVARVLLALMFILIFVPAGLLLRLCGKDPLKLKRSSHSTSYWCSAKAISPLDRLF
jgi:hypothetical protein